PALWHVEIGSGLGNREQVLLNRTTLRPDGHEPLLSSWADTMPDVARSQCLRWSGVAAAVVQGGLEVDPALRGARAWDVSGRSWVLQVAGEVDECGFERAGHRDEPVADDVF